MGPVFQFMQCYTRRITVNYKSQIPERVPKRSQIQYMQWYNYASDVQDKMVERAPDRSQIQFIQWYKRRV